MANPNSRRIGRRALCVGLTAFGIAAPAYAGSYLDRAAILLAHGKKEAGFMRGRLRDKELAKVLFRLASERLSAASKMSVPKEVTQAHPHLLLVFENYERAMEQAVKGKTEKFLIYQLRAQNEARILGGVLKQLGYSLPKV